MTSKRREVLRGFGLLSAAAAVDATRVGGCATFRPDPLKPSIGDVDINEPTTRTPSAGDQSVPRLHWPPGASRFQFFINHDLYRNHGLAGTLRRPQRFGAWSSTRFGLLDDASQRCRNRARERGFGQTFATGASARRVPFIPLFGRRRCATARRAVDGRRSGRFIPTSR